MSKITFRADDDLVEQLEEINASKSEVMREALREFLARQERPAPREEPSDAVPPTVDDALTARIDELVEERVDERVDERVEELLDTRLGRRGRAGQPQDVNVNISVDGAAATEEPTSDGSEVARSTADPEQAQPATGPEEVDRSCGQCGEEVDDDNVYCPNCGEKQSHRVFCDCGDEVRTDWAFCPSCGRRTPSADVLERS